MGSPGVVRGKKSSTSGAPLTQISKDHWVKCSHNGELHLQRLDQHLSSSMRTEHAHRIHPCIRNLQKHQLNSMEKVPAVVEGQDRSNSRTVQSLSSLYRPRLRSSTETTIGTRNLGTQTLEHTRSVECLGMKDVVTKAHNKCWRNFMRNSDVGMQFITSHK